MERAIGRLLRFDIGCANHLGPLVRLVSNELAQVSGRHCQWYITKLDQLGLYPRIGKGSNDFLIEPLDDFSRRVAGRSESTHQSRLIARQKIANGRQIRERFVPHRRGHRQSAEPAGFNMFNCRRCGGEYRLHLSAEQIGNRLWCAAIWHVDQVDTSHHLEQFARYMGRASDAARSKADLAWIGFDVRDELWNSLGWERWMDHEDKWCSGNARDWRAVAGKLEL